MEPRYLIVNNRCHRLDIPRVCGPEPHLLIFFSIIPIERTGLENVLKRDTIITPAKLGKFYSENLTDSTPRE